jgi:hypothetical protein
MILTQTKSGLEIREVTLLKRENGVPVENLLAMTQHLSNTLVEFPAINIIASSPSSIEFYL